MYLEYFGLHEAPFSITPDPAFVYLSSRHRDALAHLLYGVGQGGSGGFVQLTGEVGTGKTTLCRCLLEQVPENTRIALVLNPLLTPRELLAAICEELRIDITGCEDSSKLLVDLLNRFLLDMHEWGERVVIVIDEAQNLSPEALEQVRLLTNLETSKEKLLQIVLLGQPELRELLQRRSLRQLAQRITARYHLTPLGVEDTAHYVKHRMQIAGAPRNPFRRQALRALYQRSHGIPRLINIIADRALVGAYATEKQEINARLVHAAADEVQLGEPGVSQNRVTWWLAGAVGVLLALASWYALRPTTPPVASPATGVVEQAPQPGNQPLEAAAVPATPGDEEPPRQVPTDPLPAGPAEPVAGPVAEPAVDTRNLEPRWLEVQHQLAWRGLAESWGDVADAALVQAACEGQAGLGFACLKDFGNWSRIQQLGLPVVLELQGEYPGYLLLRGIDQTKVVAGTANDSRDLDRQTLDAHWLGAYFVAWPQAPDWPRQIGRGDTGPAVDTVLALAATTESPYQGEPEFGDAFESWLERFQARNGLNPDGIVGPKTLLYLMKSSLSEPNLNTRHTADS